MAVRKIPRAYEGKNNGKTYMCTTHLKGTRLTEQSERHLLGKWVSDPSIGSMELVTMVFRVGGELEYTIHGNKKDEKIFLKYRVEADAIVTDQLTHSREERTLFRLTDDGRLVLIYNTQEYWYIRAK